MCELQIVLDPLFSLHPEVLPCQSDSAYRALRHAAELLALPTLRQVAPVELVKFFRAAKGQSRRGLPKGWTMPSDKAWSGVTSIERTEHGYALITGIEMRKWKLRGRLTKDVAKLALLKQLNLGDNELQGSCTGSPQIVCMCVCE